MNFDVNHPTESNLRSINIQVLLPQRPPLVVVSKLTCIDEHRTVTETIINEDCYYVEDGQLCVAGVIENMAQTCAARIGYINYFILKREIQIGYIGAVSNLDVINTPKVGNIITTCMEIMAEVGEMILAKTEIKCNNQKMATAEIKIAIKKTDKNERT